MILKNSDSLSPSQKTLDKLLERFQDGAYGDTQKLALSIIKDFPKHPYAWKVLGAVLGKTGRKLEALNAHKQAVVLSPQDATAQNNLGISFKELGRLEESKACNIKQ